jgi:hypothetical protein
MNYYDLIGTLVTIPHKGDNLRGYIKALDEAQVIYQPRGSFKIITAQPVIATKRVRTLIQKRFPNCLDVVVVGNTAAKIRALDAAKATNYTDNDARVRAAIAKALPAIKLYQIKNGVKQGI